MHKFFILLVLLVGISAYACDESREARNAKYIKCKEESNDYDFRYAKFIEQSDRMSVAEFMRRQAEFDKEHIEFLKRCLR